MTRDQLTCYKAIVFALMFGSIATATTDVTLRERVEANGTVVRLSDVAEVVSADRQQARRWAAVPLMPAPAPGTQRFLRKREVEDFVAAQGAELSEVRIDGAAQVTIVGATDGEQNENTSGRDARPMNRHQAILAGELDGRSIGTIDPIRAGQLRDEVRRAVVGYVNSKTGQAAAWGVTCDVPERHLELLDAATSPLVCQGGSSPWTGRQRFVVSFATAKGEVEIPVYVEVSLAPAPVIVAVRSIARGEVIAADHVELRTIDSSLNASDRRSTVDAFEKLIGMEARQAIQVGEIVFADQVQAPALVKRGEVITVSSQGSGIHVRTTARAREDGAHGQMVQVESLGTRERYDVRVVGPRQAAIVAISKPAFGDPSERINTARR